MPAKRKNGNRIMRKLSSNAPALRRFGVRKLGLFGSAVNGNARPDSDIDVLVEFEAGKDTFANLLGLHEFLKGLLEADIDLVTTGSLSPYIGPHILKEVEYVEGLS